MNPFSVFAFFVIAFLLFWVVALYSKIDRIKASDGTEEAREKRKKDVISFLRDNGKITNNEAQNLWDVADSTATKYLQQLEDEGIIVQKGKTGHYVHYILK